MRIGRPELAWAFYDWANSAFATTVMAGFFPVFFKQYWAAGLTPTDSSFQLGLGNSLASLFVLGAAPLIGAIADRGGLKLRLILLFTVLGVAMTGGLYLVAQGNWVMALLFYVLAQLGFSAGMVCSDALLLAVSPRERWDFTSALGYALGYLGGGLLFGANVVMGTRPGWFGLVGPWEAVRVAFLTVAVWWAVFSVPVFLFVREPPRPDDGGRGRRWMGAAFAQLVETFRHIRAVRPAFLFLFAYWLYIDGVDTVVRMADEMAMPEHPGCLMVMTMAITGCSQELKDALAQVRAEVRGRFRARIEPGIREGDVPAGTDALALTDFYGAVVSGMALLARSGATRKSLRATAEQALQVFPGLPRGTVRGRHRRKALPA